MGFVKIYWGIRFIKVPAIKWLIVLKMACITVGSAMPLNIVSSIMGVMITASMIMAEIIHIGLVVSVNMSSICCGSSGICKLWSMLLMISAVKITSGMIAM